MGEMVDFSHRRLWVLGARDPEMQHVRALLEACGESVRLHVVKGKRCYPGNAYRGDVPVLEAGVQAIRVECDWPGSLGAIVVDHHRPGDPGYGVAAEDFLRGASIGQVLLLLARWGRLAALGFETSELREPGLESGLVCVADGWIVQQGGQAWRVPEALLWVAAADHCLGAAYRGRCPGVDPDALLAFRAGQDADWRGVPLEQVMDELRQARDALLQAPRLPLVAGVEVADLRGHAGLELNEAAARWGLPYVAELPDRSGRIKVVLRVASPEIMAAWPAWARDEGLEDLYGGDPARGFAGGYRPLPDEDPGCGVS